MGVICKGTSPILKYELENGGWRGTVFIDDDEGNILVEFDGRQFFGHWWGLAGRGRCSLRSFLVHTDVDYINDKLSYGLPRWDGDKAAKELYKLCETKHGHIESWPCDLVEAVEGMEDSWPAEAFYAYLYGHECFNDVFVPGEQSFGEIGANLYVIRFTEKLWPALIEHWKKELGDEG